MAQRYQGGGFVTIDYTPPEQRPPDLAPRDACARWKNTPRPWPTAHHQPGAGGTMPRPYRRSEWRGRARLHQGARGAGTRDGGCDGHAAPCRRAPSRYAGIPVSLKDLFDIAGEATPAGSRVLADAPPATAHAPVVQRMLAAGFVPVGRTNMTEFAFSGLGINPHYGTPRSPWDRASARIPGGSSSGTAVSVSDGMAVAGSAPIPAAPAAFRQRSAASSATSRPRGACRSPGCCRWRRASIRWDRWRRASHAAR